MMLQAKRVAWGAVLALFAAAVPLWGQATKPPTAATDFDVGQAVEVREGDVWSAATILKKEGRRYQIRYADGAGPAAEEWVTIDRLRKPGDMSAAAPTAPGVPGAPAASEAAPTPKPQVSPYRIGDTVEVKWGGLWRKAAVTNKSPDSAWTLVMYDNGPFHEWVEPWRMRKVGSKQDIPYATPNTTLHKPEPPPKNKPGPMPSEREAGATASNEESTDTEHTPITARDLTAATEIILGGTPPKWPALAPDAAPAPGRAPSAQPIGLGGGTGDFFESVRQLLLAGPDASIAAAVHVGARPGQAHTFRVERVDFAAARTLNTAEFPLELHALALSPDGTRLLARSAGSSPGSGERLDVWRIDSAATPAHVVSFRPYEEKDRWDRDITWAAFVDADHVLTANRKGRVILWKLAGAKAAYIVEAGDGAVPALSAGRKYLALATDDGVALLDTLTGKLLGVLDGKAGGATVSISPDGTRVAAASTDRLRIWNLTGGQLAHDLSPVGATGDAIDWLSDGYVLLDGQYLVSPEKQMVVWRYRHTGGGGRNASGVHGGRLVYVAPREGGRGGGERKVALVAAQLPHDAATKAITAAPAGDVFLVQPGATVALDVRVSGIDAKQVTDALRAKLEANGVTVAAGGAAAPVTLVATTEHGKSHDMTYTSGVGPWRKETKTSAAELKYRLAFVTPDGKTAWERTSLVTPPPMLMMKENQTVEQALSEAMAPRGGFFASTHVPARVPKPEYRGGFGASQLTLKGPQPVTEQPERAAGAR